MLMSLSFEILTVKNAFCSSPRRWQQSDKSGITGLETGAWISAKSQKCKSGRIQEAHQWVFVPKHGHVHLPEPCRKLKKFCSPGAVFYCLERLRF